MKIHSNLVDIYNKRIDPAEIIVQNGIIQDIQKVKKPAQDYILPGFIDAHIHIESSMLTPSQFSKMAVRFGTVATVSDPHEIANVLGVNGVQYMIDDARHTPFKFFFGAPSCVPATGFETAGATIDSNAIKILLQDPDIWYLAEMMNYPGVLFEDKEVMQKIKYAQTNTKSIDGHAPGLAGDDAIKYIQAGIQTDHECVTYKEALHKLKHGMQIIIREGSAAKNFDALIGLLTDYPESIMFCSDDKHPDDLLVGHINQLVVRAIQDGIPLFHVLRAACLNPILHYSIPVGSLRKGDPADFILVNDLHEFEVKATYIEGREVFTHDRVTFEVPPAKVVNKFSRKPIRIKDIDYKIRSENIRVIKAIDGSLVTLSEVFPASSITDSSKDVLKIVVVNRYFDVQPAIAFVNGFGINNGAIASSVAHDSHNIIAVGTDDDSLTNVINLVIKAQGGVACVHDGLEKILPLPIAGLMSPLPGDEVARLYESIDLMAKQTCGSTLNAPFMTLSFMALLVIPSLKLSDKGLFDGESFNFVEIEL